MTTGILFAKIIPPNIEVSLYALQCGLTKLSNNNLASYVTILWNKWFNITGENLDDLWKLMVVGMVFSLVPLAFLWMVPSRDTTAKI
jgi:hypothetical protein